MIINEKDRGQLLRMAGNIACGLVLNPMVDSVDIGKHAAWIALETMKEVDKLITKETANEPAN